MGVFIIGNEVEQRAVALMFLGKLFCHNPNGPCPGCVGWVREHLLDRAWPALKQALEAAATHGAADVGYGILFVASATMGHNECTHEDHEEGEEWKR